MNPAKAVYDRGLGPTLTSTYGRVTALRRNRTALVVGPLLGGLSHSKLTVSIRPKAVTGLWVWNVCFHAPAGLRAVHFFR